MVYRKPSLRNAISGHDTATGEGLRDLEGAVRSIVPIRVIARTVTYTPPIYLTAESLPVAVIMGRCKLASDPQGVIAQAAVAWVWENSQVKITSIPGLTVGSSYDINFLVFG